MSSPGRKVLRSGVFLNKGSSEVIGTESETVMGTLKMLWLFTMLFSYVETIPLVFVGLLSAHSPRFPTTMYDR